MSEEACFSDMLELYSIEKQRNTYDELRIRYPESIVPHITLSEFIDKINKDMRDKCLSMSGHKFVNEFMEMLKKRKEI